MNSIVLHVYWYASLVSSMRVALELHVFIKLLNMLSTYSYT